MVGILSVDFDYFIDCSSEERDLYFPSGNDEVPKDELDLIWKERYERYPNLIDLGVINDYYVFKNYLLLSNVPNWNIYVSDSHKYIKKVIDKIPKKLPLMIVNIDFHHDYYHYYRGNDKLNCGNWLRRVVEERPNIKVIWIRREDSQTISLEGEFPFEHTTDIKIIFKEDFDYIFICRSPEWSPPHLRGRFNELVSSVYNGKTP